MNCLLIPVDSATDITPLTIEGDWTSMRDAIGGECRHIERVRTRLTQPHLGNLVLCVDEMGLFHDWTRNERASALYAPGAQPGIYGPALLFREQMHPDGGLDFASVREGDLDVVRGYLSRVVAA